MLYLWMFIVVSSQFLSIMTIQITVHLTDLACQTSQRARHHCLEVSPVLSRSQSVREIISYCLTECPHLSTSFNHTHSHHFSSFTFRQLAQQNITSEHLYSWSASIDLIEQYQHYLDQPDQYINNEETDLFYNCTWPRFGPTCQYTFDHLESSSSHSYTSLSELVNDYYLQHPYTSTTFICYEHLKCDRGPAPSCLDWSEICDGKIDCANGGQDEEQCWKLEMNECDDDEYQCLNGQCIHRRFYSDQLQSPECIDSSDEKYSLVPTNLNCERAEPMIICEDTACQQFRAMMGSFLSNRCSQQQGNLLANAHFSARPRYLSENCWFSLVCRTFTEASFIPLCSKHCFYAQCGQHIAQHCPQNQSFFFIPSGPVLFGQLHLIYTRQQLLGSKMVVSPDFICMDSRFCHFIPSENTTFTLDDLTCLSATSIKFLNHPSLPFDWTQKYLKPVYDKYSPCAALPDHYYHYCDGQHSHLYRCINTSKCISKHRLLDKVRDCFYDDDEQMESVARFINLANDSAFFHCVSSKTFISYRLVADGRCDCPSNYSEVCDDEETETKYALNHILFQTICDGFTDLAPVLIEGQWMTDETDCQNWLCDNIYTQCDTIWNCLDGRDEVNCNLSSSLSILCSSDSRSCISPVTNELFCLPVSKISDGHVDCLGATDEPLMCRIKITNRDPKRDRFHCKQNDSNYLCLQSLDLCKATQKCKFGDDQQFCRRDVNGRILKFECLAKNTSMLTPAEKQLCERLTQSTKTSIVHFSINDKRSALTQRSLLPSSSNTLLRQVYHPHCRRGLNLRVWSNTTLAVNDSSTVICLCPPSFYGTQCQHQNQRISLTFEFRALSDAWQIIFVIVAFLIDHTHSQNIHSVQQLIYLPYRDCQVRFNTNLLFATRPFNPSLNYSIHFDIFEQHSHHHRASYLAPIIFPFLPVYRLALLLDIPRLQSVQSCTDIGCGKHGRCLRYARVFHSRSSSLQSFCQCDPGWSGRFCTIRTTCACAPGARCLGTLMNTNRSICLCPSGRFGPRCYLSNRHICQDDKSGPKCLNGGRCIPNAADTTGYAYRTYTCQCRDGFTGNQCQYNQTQLIISFDPAVIKHFSELMLVHFIRSYPDRRHENASTFKLIPFNYAPISLFWSHPFHLVFVEFHHHHYYLAFVRPIFNQSEVKIKTMIRPSDRCPHIRELLSPELVRSHLLYRIKWYHLLCQSNKTLDQISCFYDDIHLCLCQPSPRNGDRREANCLEYDHDRKFDCLGQNACENGGQCFQDNPTCPQTSVCMCNECSYGRRCQFTMDGFRLSLDAILGYHILPHVPLKEQPSIVHLALGLTSLMTVAGTVNGFLVLITLKNKTLRQVGSGWYLLTSSITVLILMVLFQVKFVVLLTSQMGLLTNEFFLKFQCQSVDYLLRVCLNLDQWLCAFVSLERAMTIMQGIRFKRAKSRKQAKCTIVFLIVTIVGSTIFDPLHRRLINDSMNSNDEESRIWCVASYSKGLQTVDAVIHMFHFCIPFVINIVSALVIIWRSARSRRKTQMRISFAKALREQLDEHKHILIGPIVIVILSIPRLVLVIVSGCMKSNSQSRIYLAAYLISFAPALSSFVIFVLPSKHYKTVFQNNLQQYRNIGHFSLRITRTFITTARNWRKN